MGGKILFIDEIHKYPEWAKEIKNIYDLFPDLKIVFSGSSILKLLMGSVDLSRRAVLYNLSGLSFREFLQILLKKEWEIIKLEDLLENHKSIALALYKEFKPLQYFNEYLKYGYYPFFLQSEATYQLKLQSVITFIIENEINALTSLDNKNILKLKYLLQIIASSVPYQPNITKLADVLEINRNTLLHYLDLLEKTGIIIKLYSAGSFYGKLSKPEKILLSHPNLAFCLNTGVVNKGSIRESLFVNQLQTQHKVELAKKADYIVDNKFTFEIGGKAKNKKQISGIENSFIVSDDMETGFENKIPLWLFGMLY